MTDHPYSVASLAEGKGVMDRRKMPTAVEIRRALRAALAAGFDRVELVNTPEGLKIVAERSARKSEHGELELEL